MNYLARYAVAEDVVEASGADIDWEWVGERMDRVVDSDE